MDRTAYLSSEGRYTILRFGDQRLKIIAPYSLEKYTAVLEWDKGYLVVKAKYAHQEETEEEYIDLIPTLDNLLMDKDAFLAPIEHVEINYEEPAANR